MPERPEMDNDDDTPEFTGAVLFCPVCCSSLDATGWGLNDLTCPDCGTYCTVMVDPEIVAEFSRYG